MKRRDCGGRFAPPRGPRRAGRAVGLGACLAVTLAVVPGVLLAESTVDRPAAGPGRAAILDALWPGGLGAKTGEAQIHKGRDLTPQPLVRERLADPPPPLSAADATTIRSVVPRAGQRPIAITFDLCESAGEQAGYQGDVVDLLRAQGVPATFFAGGKWMRSHSERTMQLMADPLFEVGSHGWSHRNLRTATAADVEREILWPQIEYQSLRGQLAERATAAGLPPEALDRVPPLPRLFRFPFGACRPDALAQVAGDGMRAIQWTIVTGDPSPKQTATAIVHTVLTQATPGAIVIFHANGRGHGTHDALVQLLPALRARGFEFVTVSRLLDPEVAERPVTAQECYELRPGDAARYDRLGR